jgi:hypothetical protein
VIRRLWLTSITVRVIAAIGFVVAGYVALHDRFAAVDAAIAATALRALGFAVSNPGPGDLSVHAGDTFNLYAVVTGSCSSAAGVLGLAAVSLVLLPGRPWRRLAGGVAAALLFVVFNVARICSIILTGWWLATGQRGTVLTVLVTLTIAGLVVALLPHGRLMLRMGALLFAGLFGALAYDVHQGHDYLKAMDSYHALAGPILTFGGLAIGVLVIWRALVGPEDRLSTPWLVSATAARSPWGDE